MMKVWLPPIVSRAGDEVTKNYSPSPWRLGRRIQNLPTSFSGDNEAISKKYADDRAVSEANKFLPLDGSRTITGDIDLGNEKVTNSAAPAVNGTDLCNKNYVDSKSSNVDFSNYLDKTKGGNIEKALNFTCVRGADRRITGISDQPLNATSVINDNELQSELVKEADLSTVVNGLDGKLDKTTFNNALLLDSSVLWLRI